MTTNSEGHSIARRDVLKKTAVVGAIAWTAPVIMSSRAFAQEDPSFEPGPLCPRVYVFKLENGCVTATPKFCNEAMYAAASAELDGDCIYLPNNLSQVVTGCSGGDDNQGRFTLAEGFSVIGAIGKKRATECNAVPITSTGGRSYKTELANGEWQSHVYILVCGPDTFGTQCLSSTSTGYTEQELQAILAEEGATPSLMSSSESSLTEADPTTTAAPTTAEATTTTAAPTTTAEATTTTAAPTTTTEATTTTTAPPTKRAPAPTTTAAPPTTGATATTAAPGPGPKG